MSLFSTIPESRHQLRLHSSFLFVLSGIGLTGVFALGSIVVWSILSRNLPPNKLLAAFLASILLSLLLWLARKRFAWLLDEGVIKGIQFGSSRVFVISAIRFANVRTLNAVCDTGSILDRTGYSFHLTSQSGWFRGVSFSVKHGRDAANALEFLMLHTDRSVWDPELEDWAYSWLRKQGKHLPRIV